MKVILTKDVKDVGKTGDLVSVSAGFARNFLFPRGLGSEATEAREKEYEHLKRVGEARKAKAVAERKEMLKKINGTNVQFKVQAGENDKLFGTITTADISRELEKHGFSIDRRDIHLEEPVKVLGSHKATIKYAEGAEAMIQISVDRA